MAAGRAQMLPEIHTPRLILRPWRDSDRDAFHRMSSDPEVMAFFPSTLTRQESDSVAAKISGLIEKNGWGFWALEEKTTSDFIGFAGLNVPSDKLPFSPCVEIGWRLRRQSWGRGFATEAALKSLEYAFLNLGLSEIVAFAVAGNSRSIKVMERIGMKADGEFEHPELPAGSSLRRHVLFRISKKEEENLPGRF